MVIGWSKGRGEDRDGSGFPDVGWAGERASNMVFLYAIHGGKRKVMVIVDSRYGDTVLVGVIGPTEGPSDGA